MPDGVIAELAALQYGVVARWQLLTLGLSRRMVGHRLRSGRLHPLHRGVYAVGHRHLTREARLIAAVLAGGRGAVLSHRSAAAHWNLLSPSSTVEIAVRGRAVSLQGVRIHRNRLRRDEVTVHRGIPVTTVPRTQLDLAAVAARHVVAKAFHEAEVQRLTERLSLPAIVRRHSGQRGITKVRGVLNESTFGIGITRQEMEDRFQRFLSDRGLPRPITNVHVDVGEELIELDCLWRDANLDVELDGRASHQTAAAFDRDRLRDRKLKVAGFEVVRVTWSQLHHDADALERDLRALLARPGHAAPR